MSNFKDKRQFQYNVIKTYLSSHMKMNYSKLALKLGCCRQHAKFLVGLYKKDSLLIQDHKNVGKIRKNHEQAKSIVAHYKDSLKQIISKSPKSAKLNFSAYFRLLFPSLNINLTRRTIHNYLINECIFSNKSWHTTKKRIRKLMKENNTPKEIIKLLNKIDEVKKIKPYKGKDGMIPGTSVELDACCDYWCGKEKHHLYMAIDSATGYPLAYHLEKEETTRGYFVLIKKVISEYGKPKVFLTDKRRSFWGSETTQTLIGSALSDLNINLECSSNPTFKPNVERSFDSWQNLIPVLSLKYNIDSIEKLDKHMDEFMKIYIKEFRKQLNFPDGVFTKATEDEIKLLNPRIKVKVHDSLCVSFEGQLYGLFNVSNQRVLLKPKGYIYMINNVEDNNYFTIYQNKKYYIRPVSRNDIWEPISNSLNEYKEKIMKLEQKCINKNKNISQNLEKKRIFLENWEAKLYEKEKRLELILETIE